MATADTSDVVTGSVTVAEPGGTVTLAGTCAAPLLLDRVTVMPPAGAKPLSVIVAVLDAGPIRLPGLTASDERTTAAGVTVRLTFSELPL